MSKSKTIGRRVIAFAGALIITFNIAAAPQRARAVAVTASVVASVAAIMTACGVSYWASTQDEAIEYMADKITSYFGSLDAPPASYEEWLGISSIDELFSVTANGAMRFGSAITNKILGFVRWFNYNHDIVSDGAPLYYPARDLYVTQDVNLNSNGQPAQQGTISAVSDGEDTVVVTFDSLFGNGRTVYPRIAVKLPDSTSGKQWECRVTAPNLVSNSCSFNVSFASFDPEQGDPPIYIYGWSTLMDGQIYQKTNSYGHTYLILSFMPNQGAANAANGAARFVFKERVFGDARTRVTPSAAVSVPEDVADDESFDVAPSVPLSDGMDVGQASAAVLGGVISEDGLTADGEAVEGGAAAGWGWLADLLEHIRQAVQGTQEQTAPAQYEAIDSYSLDLTSFFPFCIPWDLHRGLSLLVAEPVAPSINWTVPLPDGSTYTLALDLSDWDGVAQVARTMELLAFVVALAVATKKLIKW